MQPASRETADDVARGAEDLATIPEEEGHQTTPLGKHQLRAKTVGGALAYALGSEMCSAKHAALASIPTGAQTLTCRKYEKEAFAPFRVGLTSDWGPPDRIMPNG